MNGFTIENGVLLECQSDDRHIDIPDGVTEIGDSAFENLVTLESLYIPDSVSEIGDFAFFGCRNLSSLRLPEGDLTLGRKALGLCHALKELHIPKGLKYIDDEAFCAAGPFERITCDPENPRFTVADGLLITKEWWEDGYKYRGGELITARAGISRLDLTKDITSVAPGCFEGNTTLEEVVFERDSALHYIGRDAFKGCTALREVRLPETVYTIDDGAFSGCSSLASVEMPGHIERIGSFAFHGCSINELCIAPSVESLGERIASTVMRYNSSGAIPAHTTCFDRGTLLLVREGSLSHKWAVILGQPHKLI